MDHLTAANPRLTLIQQRLGAAIVLFSLYLALRPPALSVEGTAAQPILYIGAVGIGLLSIGLLSQRWPRAGLWANCVAVALMAIYLVIR